MAGCGGVFGVGAGEEGLGGVWDEGHGMGGVGRVSFFEIEGGVLVERFNGRGSRRWGWALVGWVNEGWLGRDIDSCDEVRR